VSISLSVSTLLSGSPKNGTGVAPEADLTGSKTGTPLSCVALQLTELNAQSSSEHRTQPPLEIESRLSSDVRTTPTHDAPPRPPVDVRTNSVPDITTKPHPDVRVTLHPTGNSTTPPNNTSTHPDAGLMTGPSSDTSADLCEVKADPICGIDQLQLSSWGLPREVLLQYRRLGITSMFPWQAECLCTGSVLGGTSFHVLHRLPFP